MKAGGIFYKWIPVVVMLAVAGAVFVFMIASHYAVTKSFQTTYRLVKTTQHNLTFFEVGCAKWWAPSFNHRKTFMINTYRVTGETNEQAQLRAAENYLSELVASSCEPVRTNIIKQIQ